MYISPYASEVWILILLSYISRDITIGIANDYGLDDRGVGDRVPVGSRIFFSSSLQTGSGVHPTSCPIDTGASFNGGKAAGA
jgi:hypothetical protein